MGCIEFYVLGAFVFGTILVAANSEEMASRDVVLPVVLMAVTWPIWALGIAIAVLRNMTEKP